MENILYYGDNLDVMRLHIKDETVDLVYLDPPFNSNASYNVLFAEKNGSKAVSQIRAFEDTWTWNQESENIYHDLVISGGCVSDCLQAFRTFLGECDVLAYLVMMAPRLVELRRVLKPTGSIYLHCDPTASHYLKMLMDAVFSPVMFQNEIIWRRTGYNSAAKRFGPLHQIILYYKKTADATFNLTYTPYTKGYIEDFFTEEDDRGRYRPVLLTGPGTRTGESGKAWRHYNPTLSGRHWQPASYLYEKYKHLTGEDLAQYPLLERFDKLDSLGLISWPKKKDGVPNYRYYLADAPGVLLQDIWAYQPGTEGCVYGNENVGIDEDVKWLSTKDRERLGYQTQKPEGILERIIKASSNPGDIILDPFCGCGTTIAVAQKLDRFWIGIDITHLAINLIKRRLKDSFGIEPITYAVSSKKAETLKAAEASGEYREPTKRPFYVVGEPTSLPDAAILASSDKYQFQWWALGLVGARPDEQKKGADKGIDGRITFQGDKVGNFENVIISVKGGENIGVAYVRDLRGVLDREKAAIGVLITMQEPTEPMKTEALKAGFYESASWGEKYPKIQLLTIAELLAGNKIDMPSLKYVDATFKKSPKAPVKQGKQQEIRMKKKKQDQPNPEETEED